MILNTGNRTDIPAFFSEWFYERIKEGYVCTRNPYFPAQVTQYRLDAKVVDCLVFCTKNPAPMLKRHGELAAFGQYWFVTITPYGKEIEPYVPDVKQVIHSFRELSQKVGRRAVCWRYDPVFLSERYTQEFHTEAFARMAEMLSGYTGVCVISFIDLYEKTLRNFKEAKSVPQDARRELVRAFAETGKKYGMKIKTCAEGEAWQRYGVDVDGCLTKDTLEQALGEALDIPARGRARADCPCLLGNDIGMYNTCGHGCVYCYANYDNGVVEQNFRRHDVHSPFLIGDKMQEDVVHMARQESYRSGQLKLLF